MMASSPPAQLCYLLLLLVLLLLATLTSPFVVRASSDSERRHSVEDKRPALPPALVPVSGRGRQKFHLAPTTGPMRERRSRAARGGGGGTGAWTFSAMLPRGFVPPSGSSACHNDMPDTAADAQFYPCSGAGTP